MKNKRILQYGLTIAVVLMALYVVTLLSSDSRGYQPVDTSVALKQLDAHNVTSVEIDDREQRLRLTLKEGIEAEGKTGVTEVMAKYPFRASSEIFQKVQASQAEKYTTNVTQENFLVSMLSYVLPMLLVFGLLMLWFSRMQGGRGGLFGIGASRAKKFNKDNPTATFEDVAGVDEALDELQEIKDFLEDPSAYEALGAKIPRGVVLYGAPGTGKTLLARAVAGEAGVPFYSISGSEFVEMFVGVGASRVRDLFKQAKENSPCIVFVDEIDAVGRRRDSGMGGGHDEREQTLNQLLVEMDGFDDRGGVIVMAATNRLDMLDVALLRPGRFDRQIPVDSPDLKGREQILKVHAKGKPFASDVDLKAVAKRTAGMSGADLENVLNEAALLTARIGGNVITGDALEEAADRVIGGPRRSSRVISEKEKKVTAYHEGGHTLAAWSLENIERVHKVTILARGRTGGHAMTVEEDDKGMYNRDELFARLVFSMGGRAAEELVFGEQTTGAGADIEHATKIAIAMVTEYGMSTSLGMVKYGQEQGNPFSRTGSGGGTIECSPETLTTIDREVRQLLDKAHEIAYSLLKQHRDKLDTLAAKLLEKETLRRPDLEVLLGEIKPQSVSSLFPSADVRFGRQIGREPVKTPTELAIERGEEPPKPFSLLEASKQARARRKAAQEERERQAAAAGQHPQGQQDPRGQHPQAPSPQGPQGWQGQGPQGSDATGATPQVQRGYHYGQAIQPEPQGRTWGQPAPSNPGQAGPGAPGMGHHPGEQRYADGNPYSGQQGYGHGQAGPNGGQPYAGPNHAGPQQAGSQGAGASGAGGANPVTYTGRGERDVRQVPDIATPGFHREEIGFRLPENEQPDHPERPEPQGDAEDRSGTDASGKHRAPWDAEDSSLEESRPVEDASEAADPTEILRREER